MRHDEAVTWLVDLEEGRLAGEERARVGAHAASCPACSAWLRTYRELGAALRPAGKGGQEHPSSEALARFTASPEELDGAAWKGIEEHLERCAACRDDAGRLHRILTDAPGDRAAHRTLRRPPRRWAAALAASVLLAVALPAAYFLGRAGAPGPDGWAGPVDVLVIRGAERAAPTPRVLRVRPGQERLTLAAVPPLPGELVREPGTPVSIRVETADGASVWSAELTSGELARRIEERGALFLSLPSSRLPPGSYRLRIGPAGAGGELLLDAPFRVAAAAP